MAKKRALRLNGSNEILYWLDKDVDKLVLEDILKDAEARGTDLSRRIIVTHYEPVANFNEENPRFKNVEYRVPLKELFRLYKGVMHTEYKKRPKEYDIKELVIA